MTLEERTKKAITNIEGALKDADPRNKVRLSEMEYLNIQICLLKNLLKNDSW